MTNREYATFASVPDSAWESAVMKARVLGPLAELAACTTEQMDEAAEQLRVSRATVYRLLARIPRLSL